MTVSLTPACARRKATLTPNLMAKQGQQIALQHHDSDSIRRDDHLCTDLPSIDIWSTHHQLDPSKPVWITEFAATNWNKDAPLPKEHVENFARESCKYLDTLDWVEQYAWFGPMRDTGTVGKWARMLDDEGKLTDLGKGYRGEW